MQDERIATLDVATEDVREGVALILNAATTYYEPGSPELGGVEAALGALLSSDGPSAADVLAETFYPRPTQEEIEELAETAQEAFWRVVAAKYPHVKTGDFPPDATHAFSGACERAIDVWVAFNWTSDSDGVWTREFGSIAERDVFVSRAFPERKALEVPGAYRLPDGRTLGVFLTTITIYPREVVR